LSSNTLYGTTEHGGTSDVGTVFGILPDGSGFTNLHSFLGNSMGDRDGAYPLSDLVVSDNILYGATQAGGDNNSGTVFKIGTDGANFLNLHSFAFHYNGPEETNSGELTRLGDYSYQEIRSMGQHRLAAILASARCFVSRGMGQVLRPSTTLGGRMDLIPWQD
jgi:uncharacterized repeat protein (TIGR03803 family)